MTTVATETTEAPQAFRAGDRVKVLRGRAMGKTGVVQGWKGDRVEVKSDSTSNIKLFPYDNLELLEPAEPVEELPAPENSPEFRTDDPAIEPPSEPSSNPSPDSLSELVSDLVSELGTDDPAIEPEEPGSQMVPMGYHDDPGEISEVIDAEIVAAPAEQLEQLEAAIDEGLSLIRRGERHIWWAAAQIRSQELWKLPRHPETQEPLYRSFVHYCQQKWDWKRSYANDVALAGKVTGQLQESGIPDNLMPTSVSQVLELAKVEPEKRAEVIDWAMEHQGTMTAKALRIAAEQVAAGQSLTRRQRIENDYYPTHQSLTQALKERVEIRGLVLECCAGSGDVARCFDRCITNEPYPQPGFEPHYAMDATQPEFWETIAEAGGVDWVVTNPPYQISLLIPIWQQAFAGARTGIALLLRLNYLEPCQDRRDWLHQYREHLSNLIIFSPRPQFRRDADGSDNITVAWMVWKKQKPQQGCKVDFVWDWRLEGSR